MRHLGIENYLALRKIKRGILPILSRVEAVKKAALRAVRDRDRLFAKSVDSERFCGVSPSARSRAGLSCPSCRSYPERVTTLFVVRPSSSRPHAAGVPRFPCLAEYHGNNRSHADRSRWSLANAFHSGAPTRSEVEGVETVLDREVRAHSRYGEHDIRAGI